MVTGQTISNKLILILKQKIGMIYAAIAFRCYYGMIVLIRTCSHYNYVLYKTLFNRIHIPHLQLFLCVYVWFILRIYCLCLSFSWSQIFVSDEWVFPTVNFHPTHIMFLLIHHFLHSIYLCVGLTTSQPGSVFSKFISSLCTLYSFNFSQHQITVFLFQWQLGVDHAKRLRFLGSVYLFIY